MVPNTTLEVDGERVLPAVVPVAGVGGTLVAEGGRPEHEDTITY